MKHFWYLVFMVINFLMIVHAVDDANTWNSTVDSRIKFWQNLSKSSASISRNGTVFAALKNATGIYRNNQKSRSYGLNNAVLIQVVSYNNLPQFRRYKLLMHNFFCFANHYDYKPVVYVLGDNSLHELSVEFPEVTFLTYPLELFWNILAEYKYNDIQTGPGTTDYAGTEPSFTNHGSLVMLVPVLEALQLGYDVIYLDVDVALVHDPIPYMVRGNADLIMTLESRSCDFPSRSVSTPWYRQEPNTGVMMIRHSKRSVNFFRDWLQKIVEGNVKNDQKVMDLHHVDYVPSCNVGTLSPNERERENKSLSKQLKPHISYCFLNEFLFQNGHSAFHCARGFRDGSITDYLIGMALMGVKSADHRFFTPVTVHANYCDDKEMEFVSRGLWLVKADNSSTELAAVDSASRNAAPLSERCVAYDISTTSFANWTDDVLQAKEKYLNAVQNMSAGYLFKYPNKTEIYTYRGGKLRPILNPEIITKMGYDPDNATLLEDDVYRALPRGRPENLRKSPALQAQTQTQTQSQGPSQSSSRQLRRLDGVTDALYTGLSAVSNAVASTFANNEPPKFLPSMNSTRQRLVKATLATAAGVYRDKEKALKIGVEKTVLVNVLSANRQGITTRYIQMLKNWFCFAAQYGFQPVTYILPIDANSTDTSAEEAELTAAGVNSLFLSYPVDLFHSVLKKKTTPIRRDGSRADYEGDIPSFKHYGALVMLIPMLEVLEMGYNVIYFDLDVAFVQDPVPLIINGTADFTVSLEMRTCIFPSLLDFAQTTDWEGAEPNTGVFHARSNPNSIALFHRWLQNLIDENFINDQVVLKYSQLDAKLTFSCNDKLAALDNDIAFQSKRVNSDKNGTATICFLNEFIFQNGKMITNCAPGRGGAIAEYVKAMHQNGFHDPIHKGKGGGPLISPVIAHLNYCDDKVEELNKLGLWLPHHGDAHKCKTYDVRKSFFATMDWPEQLRLAEEDLFQARAKFSNGSIIKLYGKKPVYLMVDGVLRPFPNGETFEAMGFDWMKITHMKQYSFYKTIPIGPDLPSLK